MRFTLGCCLFIKLFLVYLRRFLNRIFRVSSSRIIIMFVMTYKEVAMASVYITITDLPWGTEQTYT
jgi:hypothetical protein